MVFVRVHAKALRREVVMVRRMMVVGLLIGVVSWGIEWVVLSPSESDWMLVGLRGLASSRVNGFRRGSREGAKARSCYVRRMMIGKMLVGWFLGVLSGLFFCLLSLTGCSLAFAA